MRFIHTAFSPARSMLQPPLTRNVMQLGHTLLVEHGDRGSDSEVTCRLVLLLSDHRESLYSADSGISCRKMHVIATTWHTELRSHPMGEDEHGMHLLIVMSDLELHVPRPNCNKASPCLCPERKF